MKSNLKCWRITDGSDNAEQKTIQIAEVAYTLQDASEEEIAIGTRCLDSWYLERKYKTQVCEPGRSTPYYDMKSEMQELNFEELIFSNGACIGVYHDELVFLFGDEKTHYQQKYLGEMKISYDQGIDFYDYYYLHSK